MASSSRGKGEKATSIGNSSGNGMMKADKKEDTGTVSGSESDGDRINKNSMKENEKGGDVYIHPLSQIILLYLQDECHYWVRSKGLDRSLKIHRDGTFVLEFPEFVASKTRAPKEFDPRLQQTSQKRLRRRVWTYYDNSDKKHWLAFSCTTHPQQQHVQHRFMLQDNLLPAWNGNKRKSLPERVQECVRELMDMVDTSERVYAD